MNILEEVLKVIFITILPYIELRGAIPYVILSNKPLFLIAVIFITNFLIGVITYLLAHYIIEIGKKITGFRKIWERYIDKTIEKAEKHIKHWEGVKVLGIATFIGIPLPGTGAYSGALVSNILELDIKEFLVALFLGLVIATIIVIIISQGASTII